MPSNEYVKFQMLLAILEFSNVASFFTITLANTVSLLLILRCPHLGLG